MIDHDNKAVYIAPPRTGSQAISRHLGFLPTGGNIRGLKAQLGPDSWKEYRIVGVMRDPVERFISSWRYYYTLGLLDQKMPKKFYEILREGFQREYPSPVQLLNDFESACKRPLLYPFLQPLSDAFKDPETGRQGVTHLLYPEGMKELEWVNSLSGLPSIKDLSSELSDKAREKIETIYDIDMGRWTVSDLPTVKFRGRNLIPNS